MSERERFDDDARALLDARTRAVARASRAAVVTGEAALALTVAGERYAIAAHAVRAVAELTRLTPLPHAPPELAGLTARGGVVVPVFHLRGVLGVHLGALPEYGRVVFLGEGLDAVGLAVDAVSDGGAIDLAALRTTPLATAPRARDVVRGVTPDGVVVLDHQALLASDRLTVDIAAPPADHGARPSPERYR